MVTVVRVVFVGGKAYMIDKMSAIDSMVVGDAEQGREGVGERGERALPTQRTKESEECPLD